MISSVDSPQSEEERIIDKLNPDRGQDHGGGELGVQSLYAVKSSRFLAM